MSMTDIRMAAAYYMLRPDFVPRDYITTTLGMEGALLGWDSDDHKLYFSLDLKDFSKKKTPRKLSLDPSLVDVSRPVGGIMRLGKYEARNDNEIIVCLPFDQWKLDRHIMYHQAFKLAVYSISISEWTTFYENRCVYDALFVNTCRKQPEIARADSRNMGAFVTMRGEGSLRRLVQQVTDVNQAPEKVAQELLDFVASECICIRRLAWPRLDEIKKANETLLLKKGTSVDLAILYASLLEQTTIDYILLYTEHDAYVAVRGNYGDDPAALTLIVNGKKYHLADTTHKDSVIGRAGVDELDVDDICEIQRAGINSKVYDLNKK
ncbi:MAG: hypothetical protein EOL87_06215 [Spartobacteria bacterium]|nr:hypothetical protein [Spartobacteria bacterium]